MQLNKRKSQTVSHFSKLYNSIKYHGEGTSTWYSDFRKARLKEVVDKARMNKTKMDFFTYKDHQDKNMELEKRNTFRQARQTLKLFSEQPTFLKNESYDITKLSNFAPGSDKHLQAVQGHFLTRRPGQGKMCVSDLWSQTYHESILKESQLKKSIDFGKKAKLRSKSNQRQYPRYNKKISRTSRLKNKLKNNKLVQNWSLRRKKKQSTPQILIYRDILSNGFKVSENIGQYVWEKIDKKLNKISKKIGNFKRKNKQKQLKNQRKKFNGLNVDRRLFLNIKPYQAVNFRKFRVESIHSSNNIEAQKLTTQRIINRCNSQCRSSKNLMKQNILKAQKRFGQMSPKFSGYKKLMLSLSDYYKNTIEVEKNIKDIQTKETKRKQMIKMMQKLAQKTKKQEKEKIRKTYRTRLTKKSLEDIELDTFQVLLNKKLIKPYETIYGGSIEIEKLKERTQRQRQMKQKTDKNWKQMQTQGSQVVQFIDMIQKVKRKNLRKNKKRKIGKKSPVSFF